MEAKELRIGNLVKYSLSNIPQEIKSVISVHGDYIVNFQNSEFSNTIDKIKPIPLTEEWLLKFGFEFDTIDWQFSYPSCYFIGWYAGKWCLGTQSDGVLKETYFEYVHQLQNLYFALTGEELTQVSEGKNKNFV